MVKFIKVFGLSAMLIFSFMGCGYTTRSSIPSDIKTIHVEQFKNSVDYSSEGKRNLYVPLLEVKTRQAIIDRFLFDGNLRIKDSDNADWLLKGELINYERSPLRFTDNDDVEEYRIHVVMAFELWDQTKQELLWREPNFVGEETYFAIGALAKSEDTALQDAMVDLARRIVERTIENW
jgi:hypothetical protein